ncbi:MAG: PcfJ domain-containing protein [Tannerella sp.]|nr:PcfJ domain-containing protein [Tannerella sp.]
MSGAQKRWAFLHCIEHIGKRSAKGVITCLECGHAWHGKGGEREEAATETQCPECSARLKIRDTRKKVFRQPAYFCTVTAREHFQVLRFFFIEYYAKAGEKADCFISEVMQQWIAPGGKTAIIARMRSQSYLDLLWRFDTPLEIRPERRNHNIMGACVYPRQKLIPELKRSGYRGESYGMTHYDLFGTLLSDSRAETLLKTGQTKVLKFFAGKSFHFINDYWASIKICIRNGYQIEDVNNWKDYVKLLRFFGKDLHNAKYVCPGDLNAEHDRYYGKMLNYRERERLEEKRRKAQEDEAVFRKMKSKFFGMEFTDGLIEVRMLDSVDEIRQEGNMLHHCVYANDYHLRPDSLILSACIGDRRLETVEFSLSRMAVVQSRGLRNTTTEYHDRIIGLVQKNRRLIRKRLTGKKYYATTKQLNN